MIVGQTMLAEAEIRVLDVKCHVSILSGQDLQIDEVRIADSVSTEMISSGSTEDSRFDSVRSSADSLNDIVLQSSEAEFVPTIRSGSCCDVGCRDSMDDEHICIDDLSAHLGSTPFKFSIPTAFYAVFDGHGGPEAALYIKENAMRLFFKDAEFPQMPSSVDSIFLNKMEESHRRAFSLADLAMADETVVSGTCGTTALTALVVGRHLVVANAGDCRAVLCRKGVAINMSFDHRSTFSPERKRAEALGGFFDDGYLNGVISVTRALGDWELKLPLGSSSPLISDPDVQHIVLTEEEEFLILGCDGIWDVMSSQYAVSLVRQMLRKYDDPRKCAIELVNEALRLNSLDNLTVVVICFSSSPSPSSHGRRFSRFRSLSEESRSQLQKFLGES